MLRYLPFILILAVWIYAFIDCLNTPEKEVRKLPKVAWVIIILLFGQVLLGPIVWFAVGRPRRNAPYGATKPQERRWVAPDDNPEFLKSINERKPGPEADPSAPDSPGNPEAADTPEDRTQPAEPPRDGAQEGDTGTAGPDQQGKQGKQGKPGQPGKPGKGGIDDALDDDLRNWEEELKSYEDEGGRRDKGGNGPDDTPPSS